MKGDDVYVVGVFLFLVSLVGSVFVSFNAGVWWTTEMMSVIGACVGLILIATGLAEKFWK